MHARMPRRTQIAIAFAAVYVIWGSTYLAILYAIQTLPPMLMAGTRHAIAGALLYAFARRRGAPRPPRHLWRPAAVIGGLMLLMGNGGVVLAERTVPSGLAALIVASVPLWVALLSSLGADGRLPRGRRALALIAGFAGVALLVSGRGLRGGSVSGMTLVLVASVAWAAGSLYSRTSPRPRSAFLATAMQMLAGGGLLLVAGTLEGEWRQLDLAHVSWLSAAALGYLVVFGSLIGYTAYAWLLQTVPPTVAATYAYVNPVVAMLLGWLFAGEALGARTLVAAAIIVGSVVLVTTAPADPTTR
jgi:drug/metabolite transporter (DMT)-like permease